MLFTGYATFFMSTPTTTNTTVTTAQNAEADAVNALVSVAEAAIIADLPWMATPGLKQLWQAFFSWAAGYLSKAIQQSTAFAIIDIQVNSEQNALSAALANIVAAQKSGNGTELQAAIAAYQKAQSALVNDDGSGST